MIARRARDRPRRRYHNRSTDGDFDRGPTTRLVFYDDRSV
jgi:hypothetical protein